LSHFFLDNIEFGGFLPEFNPVDATVVGTDVTYPCVKEEFCDVGCRRAVGATGGKVFDDVFAVATEGTKVVAMASGGESEYAVELFD